MQHSLGIYVSVPFCKAKCTFCNFASGVFALERMQGYVDGLCEELRGARASAARNSAFLPYRVDTVYFGGGTPSLIGPAQLRQIFSTLRDEFALDANAEITLEAAPGQIGDVTLETALSLGVNRISLGVQSFVDTEAAAVGRLHTGAACRAEIDRLSAVGVPRVSLDLIAGLPYQTAESWTFSVEQAIESGVDHISVYMLEVDEDSRLGREAIACGDRYHASALPKEDHAADSYEAACDLLDRCGFQQYEISNFARPGFASQHNLKYWKRHPYLGVGLDAHSMLLSRSDGTREANTAFRWSNTDEMDAYMARSEDQLLPVAAPIVQWAPAVERINRHQAFEESLFLGLRMNSGVDLDELGLQFGRVPVEAALTAFDDLHSAGLLARTANNIHLTTAGRLASNEVFGRLLDA